MSKNKRKKKKKKFRIFLLVIGLLLLFSFAFIMLGAYVFKIDTKAIIIKGNDIISDEMILEEADLEDYPNFFLASSNDIEKKLKENTFIKSVNVNKNLFFQITINIKEYKPLFIREDTNMIVLDNGKETENDLNLELNIPSLVNYVPDTKYDELIEKFNQIDYSLIKKISQIVYSPTKYDEDRFILYMNDSNRVYINLPKFKSFNKYDEMVTKFEGKTGKLYLDSGNYFEIDK
ncbi:MAG: cell division protein FtsQ/DivIB [Bacilli bacterium]